MQVPWQQYEKAIADFSRENFKEELTWRKKVSGLSRYGEGDTFKTQDYKVNCLVDWNFYRRWPINTFDEDGLQDKQHCSVYIHKDELARVGLLTPEGNADINPALDSFIINGVGYVPAGDTEVGQTDTHSMMVLLILKRGPVKTGKNSRP